MLSRIILALVIGTGFFLSGPSSAFVSSAEKGSGDPTLVHIHGSQAGAPLSSFSTIPISPDGLLSFVPRPDGRGILAVETLTGKVLRSATLSDPLTALKISRDGDLLAVLSASASSISVYRTESLQLIGSSSTASGPQSADFAPDGSTIYVVSLEGRSLQSFSTGNVTLTQGTLLPDGLSDVAVSGNGLHLSVVSPDGLVLRVLNASTLAEEGTIPVPPGSNHVVSVRGQGSLSDLLITTSSIARAICIADPSSMAVLKIIYNPDPEGIGASNAFGDWAFIGSGDQRVDIIDKNPTSAGFGKRISALFSSVGNGGFGLGSGSGDLVVASLERSDLVRVTSDQLLKPWRIDKLIPDKGEPGITLTATGAFPGSNSRVLVTRDERFLSVLVPRISNDTIMDVDVPLDIAPGVVELWIPKSSTDALARGTYLADSPAPFTVLELAAGIEELIAQVQNLVTAGALGAGASTALENLKFAKSILGNGGNLQDLLQAIANAFSSLKKAGAGTPLLKWVVAVVRQAATLRLDSIQGRLGSANSDVSDARRHLEAGDGRLTQGDLQEALNHYLAASVSVEKVVGLARPLTRTQRLAITKAVVAELFRIENSLQAALVRSEALNDDDADLTIPNILTGHGKSLRGTVLRELVLGRLDNALEGIEKAIAHARKKGLPTTEAEERAARMFRDIVQRLAEMIEKNVGSPDHVATGLRQTLPVRQRGLTDLSNSVSQATPFLASSVSAGQVGPSPRDMTNMDECDPRITIDNPSDVCLRPGAPPPPDQDPNGLGNIDPAPLPITFHLSGIPADLGGMGMLLFYITREDGDTIIFSSITYLLPNGDFVGNWDGYGDNGKLVTFKGKANTERLKVKGFWICPEPATEEDVALAEFSIARPGGLIVKPSTATMCASFTTRKGPIYRKQFRAYRCKAGGGDEEVTKDCIWSVSNSPAVGTIKSDTGVFTSGDAHNKAKRTGTITAVHKKTGERGTAKVTVIPAGGGLSPGSVELCKFDTVAFHVFTTCDKDGNAEPGNDLDYNWTVTPPTAGVITQGGVFTALKKRALVTVKATNKMKGGPGPFTAEVFIHDVDEVDIVDAPYNMFVCPTVGGTLTAQVFCHSMPVNNLPVRFSFFSLLENAVKLSKQVVKTDPDGLASTDVTPLNEQGPRLFVLMPPGPTFVQFSAIAVDLEATSPALITENAVEIKVNTTTDTGDGVSQDVVRLKGLFHTTPYKVSGFARVLGNPPLNLTLVLTNPDGRLRFPENGDKTKTILLDKGGAWTKFEVSGEAPSVKVNDAAIQGHDSTADGHQCVERKVTVFHFSPSSITVTAGGKYTLIAPVFEATPGHAVDYSAQATLSPNGTPSDVPYITRLKVGIMQKAETDTYTIELTNPANPVWLPAVPAGTKVTDIPTKIEATFTFPGLPALDSSANFTPLYDKPGFPNTNDPNSLEPVSPSAGSKPATSWDNPSVRNPLVNFKFDVRLPSGRTIVDGLTVQYSWTRAKRTSSFRTWATIFDTATGDVEVVKETTWTLNVDSNKPAPATPLGRDFTPTVSPPLGPPFANRLAPVAAQTPSGSTSFTK